jgi:chromate transport protein ChrA
MTSYALNALGTHPSWSILYLMFIFETLISILLISYVRRIVEGSPFYVFNILLSKVWELLTETPADPENMILFVSCMLSVAMVVVICTVNHILVFGSVAQVLIMALRKSKRVEQVPRRNNHVYVTSTSLQASTVAFCGYDALH